MYKSGFVAIVGSPNAGKSTLLNEILDAKIAITSDKVGTTRNMIRGIYTDDSMQIVFVDTPGINTPQNKLQVYMKNQVEEAINSVDIIIYVMDAKVGFRNKEQQIIDKISKNKDVIKLACINKIDLIDQTKAFNIIEQLQQLEVFKEVFALSIKEGINVKSFLNTIKSYLPEGEKIIDDDMLVDFSTKFYISEIIREKVLRNTYDEVPHSVYVRVDEIQKQNDKYYIEAIIFVQQESQKGIVIGAKANMIKKIGQNARKDLKDYFNASVHLDLTVRVDKKWTDKRIEAFEIS